MVVAMAVVVVVVVGWIIAYVISRCRAATGSESDDASWPKSRVVGAAQQQIRSQKPMYRVREDDAITFPASN